jgi:hypothetical protein
MSTRKKRRHVENGHCGAKRPGVVRYLCNEKHGEETARKSAGEIQQETARKSAVQQGEEFVCYVCCEKHGEETARKSAGEIQQGEEVVRYHCSEIQAWRRDCQKQRW